MINNYPKLISRLILISILVPILNSFTAQYGIYLMNPAFYEKNKINTVTVYKEFGRVEKPISFYDYNARTKVMRITYYASPERPEEYHETYRLNKTGNLTLLDNKTLEEIDGPYLFKIIDHFMYDYIDNWEFNEKKDDQGKVISDSITCISDEYESPFAFLKYEFDYKGDDLTSVYYLKYDILGFLNDIQLTTLEWSSNHLRLDCRTIPLEHDDLVADLKRIVPYTLTWIFSEDGLLTNYETESKNEKEFFRFEYE